MLEFHFQLDRLIGVEPLLAIEVVMPEHDQIHFWEGEGQVLFGTKCALHAEPDHLNTPAVQLRARQHLILGQLLHLGHLFARLTADPRPPKNAVGHGLAD